MERVSYIILTGVKASNFQIRVRDSQALQHFHHQSRLPNPLMKAHRERERKRWFFFSFFLSFPGQMSREIRIDGWDFIPVGQLLGSISQERPSSSLFCSACRLRPRCTLLRGWSGVNWLRKEFYHKCQNYPDKLVIVFSFIFLTWSWNLRAIYCR